jgi:hypothetical protein
MPVLTEAEVSGIVHDSIADLINGGTELSDVAVMIADSTGNAPGNYVTRKALADSIAAKMEVQQALYLMAAPLLLR